MVRRRSEFPLGRDVSRNGYFHVKGERKLSPFMVPRLPIRASAVKLTNCLAGLLSCDIVKKIGACACQPSPSQLTSRQASALF